MCSSTPARILYMEDDEGLARLFKRNLERAGYQVDLASDGEEGLELYRSGSYDVVCVDHKMPRRSGLDVIGFLVSTGELPPTIMITGEGDETVAVEAMKLGATDYVIKDASARYLELLPSVIERALNKKRLFEEKQWAEAALAESERRYRSLFEDSPIGLCEQDWSEMKRFVDTLRGEGVTDMHAFLQNRNEQIPPYAAMIQVIDANRASLDLFRVGSKDALKQNLERIFRDDSNDNFAQDIIAVAEGKKIVDRESSMETDSGESIHVAIRWSVRPGHEHSFSRVLVSIVDITDRKLAEEAMLQAHGALEERVRERTHELSESNRQLTQEVRERKRVEQALRRSEERFRAIFETAQDCIFVKDRRLRYTHVNPAMEKLLNLPAGKIVGKTDEEIFGEQTGRHLREVEGRVLRGEFVELENTRPVKGIPSTFLDIRAPLTDNMGNITGLCGMSRDITERKQIAPERHFQDMDSLSPAMQTTLTKARLCAETDSVILLLGESGAGKDYLAKYIHDHSKRADGPFFSINCAAVAQELAESELFGHEPGAFTGAGGRKRGLLELAEGGTLLLNEVGELQPHLQAKLLTFLDTRSFTRVGGEKTVPVNARLIAATNRDLDREVDEGRFRADLFYRLNVLSITVPSLKERPEDLPTLVSRIVEKLAAEMQLPRVPEVDSATMGILASYKWPGNVRELRNVLERAMILSGKGKISVGALGVGDVQGQWTYTMKFPEDRSLNEVTDTVKRALISEALNRARGSKNKAASLLGISRFSLFRQIKALEMEGCEELNSTARAVPAQDSK
jgi:PAS domain S-box-containing protein